ncbi:Hsp70 family protein [Neptunomonas qingdaonensis]|uniref:Hsp70 protein n=1 Tax=Neptunomonas qingdaonensis TaxID=1045558 RepID=A0A1I2V3P1_9GAMM|nr:Hsp70 family protein [Neptunomonas qingdaonensis]SFG83852.1 Hsp70 protein [Neptunomonas qingdaonensis]
MKSSRPRFIVGIDLGTTHTVVAYSGLDKQGQSSAAPQVYAIPQLVAAGEVARLPLLPSFRYHPGVDEVPQGDMQLPWGTTPLEGELPGVIIGEWARGLSGKVEGRSVISAKSWLSHDQADPTAPILPWAGAEGVDKVSPVLATASYLAHIRAAWNTDHPSQPLEDQEVIVTVPASFGDLARTLTVEAARLAGLAKILLLEEPTAACYDWLSLHGAQAEDFLKSHRLLLICDVGGGTSDFSLVRLGFEGGQPRLDRIGVGDHLMLGGDNLDLALAHQVESGVLEPGKRLRASSLSQLIQQTRLAKEKLLATDAPETAKVTVLGSGARLIGGARSYDLSREQTQTLALEGFVPLTELSDMPQQRQRAVKEFGLPYATDPSISRQLAAFLHHHERVSREAFADQADSTSYMPDALLLNGGFFKGGVLAQRLCDLLCSWRGEPVSTLENSRPDLAVACGAVAHGLARRGKGVRIGGGSARSYFLKLDQDQPARNTSLQGICLLPRGTETGVEIPLPERRFVLSLGQPVQFQLMSSAADDSPIPGTLTPLGDPQFQPLPPLMAAIPAAEGGETAVEVELVATLTEVGTLGLECVAAADAARRWRLEFPVRKAPQAEALNTDVGGLPAEFDSARQLVETIYGKSRQTIDAKSVKLLRVNLERLLGPREGWEVPLLRALADLFIKHRGRRRRSQQHEQTWFNLTGFCLRPGLGYPLDDWRLEQIWPLFQQGLQFDKSNPDWNQWWTFWRRVAGGLNVDQQLLLHKQVAKYINPVAERNRKLQAELKYKAYEGMVLLAAALEGLPSDKKQELGRWLLKRLENSREIQSSWVALGRIGSRIPLHGSAHNLIDQDTLAKWIPALLKKDWNKQPQAAFATVVMARVSGDRSRDLEPELRQSIVSALQASKAPPKWIAMVTEVTELDDADSYKIYGESLPPGLKLLD